MKHKLKLDNKRNPQCKKEASQPLSGLLKQTYRTHLPTRNTSSMQCLSDSQTGATPPSFLSKLSSSHLSTFIGKTYLLNLRAAQILDFAAMEQVN